MKVIHALQDIDCLVEISTIVVMSKLLDTADNITLSSKIIYLILQTRREEIADMLPIKAGDFTLYAVLLDIFVDRPIVDEELFATSLS